MTASTPAAMSAGPKGTAVFSDRRRPSTSASTRMAISEETALDEKIAKVKCLAGACG